MQTNELRNELGTNFIEYSVAVNSDRAIPDARSGLKPVVRRILYGAFKDGFTSNKSYVKCARIAGNVMGQLHPHGDTAIYDALVRISRDWVMRYPLMDFYGNVGNIAGDPAAADRYTEARLSKLSEEGLLQNIKKKNVDFMPNYDESIEEPVTLPAIFPNLLCNPNTGIGVALACNWAPHNLGEVAEAIFAYMRGEEPNVPGPDFPTGGEVINSNDIPSILSTGHGSVKIRGRYKIEGQKIIFYEIPYGTTLEGLIQEVGEACDKQVLTGIEDIHDESSENIKIVITCEKGINPEMVVSSLFAKTSFQSSFSYNMVALVNKTPVELNFKDCIKIYLEHNIDCLLKECNFDLEKDKSRLEIVDGLLKALEDIDNVIQLIKTSKNSTDAKERLMVKYSFSEAQAKAIVDMKLGRLAGLERIEIENEKAELENHIKELNIIISDETQQKAIIKERLENIVKKFGDKRRTLLSNIEVSKAEEPEIIPEDVVVILNEAGEIKRIPKANFKVQKRNGKGVKSTDSAVIASFSTNTQDNLLLFSSSGKMYKILVDNIPECTNTSRGTNVASLIKLDYSEKIIAAASVEQGVTAKYIAFVTKQGMFKKSDINEYFNTKRGAGIQAIKLKEGDSIVNVSFINQEDYVFFTHDGMSIHFETKDIRAIGRVTQGIKAMKLNDSDYVTTAVPLFENKVIAIITENGLGKKCNVDDFPVQLPNGKGVVASHSPIVNAFEIAENDNILIIGRPTSICIQASDLPTVQRASGGNHIIKDSTVISAAKI